MATKISSDPKQPEASKTVLGLRPEESSAPPLLLAQAQPLSSSALPLGTGHAVQNGAPDPTVAKVFKTALGINLGNNTIIPIDLSQEQSTKHQAALNTAGGVLKGELEKYLVLIDKHAGPKWEEGEDHITWYRIDPRHRSIVYQLHNQPQEYHLSLSEIKKSDGQNGFIAGAVTDAMLKFEKEISAIHTISISCAEYTNGSVTLFRGPKPFDKSSHPLNQLADKTFEQALSEVQKRLQRADQEKCNAVAKKFRELKAAIEAQMTQAQTGNHTATAQALEAVLTELDAMDGSAIGIAASSKLAPKDYQAAIQLKDEIYLSVCKHLREIEEESEPGFIGGLSRHWNGWADPQQQMAREQARNEVAKQYVADVVGLCLDGHLNPANAAELQAASNEIHLTLGTVEVSTSIEHHLYPFLTTGNTTKLEAFLTASFASLGDEAMPLANTICDALDTDQSLPISEEEELP